MLKKSLYNELLLITDDYKRSLKLVEYLFKDKKDKEGEPYINHLLRVSNKLSNPNTKIAGLLHDTVEDTNTTFEDLKALGFNEEIISLVRLVTNEKDTIPLSKKEWQEKYHNKITKILESGNIEAVKLKYSDMSDNMNQDRLNKLDEKTRNHLINKYKDEIIRLEEHLKERESNL